MSNKQEIEKLNEKIRKLKLENKCLEDEVNLCYKTVEEYKELYEATNKAANIFFDEIKFVRESRERIDKLAYEGYKELKRELNESNFENLLLKRITNNQPKKPQKSKAGAKGQFQTEQQLHEAIKSIPAWQTISSKNQLAKKLGYKSSSGLNELIKSKGWSLPPQK